MKAQQGDEHVTSQSETQGTSEQGLRVESGTQVIVSHDSLTPSASLLPAGAADQLLIVSAKSPPSIERTLGDLGRDLSKVGHLPLGSTDIEYDGPLWTGPTIDPSDLTGLSMQYNRALEALEPDHGWILFDDINALLLYSDTDRVVRFLDHVAQQTREADVRGVYTVVRDAMSDQEYSALANVLDGSADLR